MGREGEGGAVESAKFVLFSSIKCKKNADSSVSWRGANVVLPVTAT